MDDICAAFPQAVHADAGFIHFNAFPWKPEFLINARNLPVSGIFRTIDGALRQKLDELFIEIFDAGADDNAFR